jgi:hypothetical protein
MGVCETPVASPLRRDLPAHHGRAQRGPPLGMRDPSDVGASASRRSTATPCSMAKPKPAGATSGLTWGRFATSARGGPDELGIRSVGINVKRGRENFALPPERKRSTQ